jgi:hypothetical protein
MCDNLVTVRGKRLSDTLMEEVAFSHVGLWTNIFKFNKIKNLSLAIISYLKINDWYNSHRNFMRQKKIKVIETSTQG